MEVLLYWVRRKFAEPLLFNVISDTMFFALCVCVRPLFHDLVLVLSNHFYIMYPEQVL